MTAPLGLLVRKIIEYKYFLDLDWDWPGAVMCRDGNVSCRVRVVLFRIRVKFCSPEANPLNFRVEIYKLEPVY